MDNLILDDEFPNSDVNVHNVEVAGFWIRVGAMLIDGLVLLPLTAFAIYNTMSIKSMPLMLLVSLLSVLYKPYMEWKKSATFGKMAVGIKVVDESMNNITMDQAVKRYFPWMISYAIAIASNIWVFTSPGFEEAAGFMEVTLLTSEVPFSYLNSVYSFIFLGLVGSLAFDSKKQGVHDKYAKTYCVQTRSLELNR